MIVKLGDEVKDRITGFRGIAVCRSEWLNGCVRIGITSKELKDGKPIDDVFIDEKQLEVITTTTITGFQPSGGDRLSPTRARDDKQR